MTPEAAEMLHGRRQAMKAGVLGSLALWNTASAETSPAIERSPMVQTMTHNSIVIGATKIFYREAGDLRNPTLLLLHGFANSSHYFRHLMPLLSDRFHLVAPDIPSFGFTEVRDPAYRYTFAQLTATMQGFVDALALSRFAMYVFDYGAPIGFNLAIAHPERVTGFISQNGNAYEEGLGEKAWAPLRSYWQKPSPAIRETIKERMSLSGVEQAYFEGVEHPEIIEPEAYWLDAALLARPGMMDLQTDLKLDYKSNIERYPLYQAYFREHRPPLLAVWGSRDPFFIPAGASAFRRDNPNAEVHLLDTGHFALETNNSEIVSLIRDRFKG